MPDLTWHHIKQIREKLDLTQREFAKLVNASHTSVQRWESGDSSPDELQRAILRRLRDHPEHPYILVGMADKGDYDSLMEVLFGDGNPLMA